MAHFEVSFAVELFYALLKKDFSQLMFIIIPQQKCAILIKEKCSDSFFINQFDLKT